MTWERWFAAWFFAALTFTAGVVVGDLLVARKGDVTVANSYRTNSFLARTRDDWVVATVSMVTGLILGYLLARATGAGQ